MTDKDKKSFPSFREVTIEKMFSAYVNDVDGGPYSGVAAAFDAVWNDIIEEIALSVEAADSNIAVSQDYVYGYNDGIVDAIIAVRKLKND